MRPNFFFTFILSLFLFIPLQQAFAATEIVRPCLGTYTFVFDEVEKNQLTDMIIVRTDDLSIRNIWVGNHGVSKTGYKDGSIDENDDEIIASYYDTDEKLLIKFDKKSKEVLVVSNSKYGQSTFIGHCF